MSDANPLREGLLEAREAGPCTIVIFGATGDLTRRKLLPALYNLAEEGRLHPDTAILGTSRSERSDDAFREAMKEAVAEFSRNDLVEETWSQLCGDMSYLAGDFSDEESYRRLAERLDGLDPENGPPRGRLFYLAVPPAVYPDIIGSLGRAGLNRPREGGWTRVIVEKPFGRDRASARELNRTILEVFEEDQVFRIDHYLGKETVQNILVFRMGNGIFEPIWNSRHVDHVQITVAESVGVGTRAGFYDRTGVVRDMLQNHIMQLLTLVCMEPPVRFDARSVRDEKVKVLEAMRPVTGEAVERHVVRGQYAAGTQAGKPVPAYVEEQDVPGDSTTETYVAARLDVENWRWSGTPFYVRSGKRLPKRSTEIAIVFRQPPVSLFRTAGAHMPRANVLTLRVQPEEGISLGFGSKAPGQTLHIDDVRMDFNYATSFGDEAPEAYERLLLDAIVGDSTLFTRRDEVELAWGIVDPLLQSWQERSGEGLARYEAGTWGPEEAEALIARDGRAWQRL